VCDGEEQRQEKEQDDQHGAPPASETAERVQPTPMLKGDAMQAVSSGNVDCPYFFLVKDSERHSKKDSRRIFLFQGLPPISTDPIKLCRDRFTRSTNSAIPHIRDHHFEIEGRWSAHGNEESSEEACKEEEVVPVP
jgi:hypothetical protein